MPVRVCRYTRPVVRLAFANFPDKAKMLGFSIYDSAGAVNQQRPCFRHGLAHEVMGVAPYRVKPSNPPACSIHLDQSYLLIGPAEHERKERPRVIMDECVLVFVDIPMQVDG